MLVVSLPFRHPGFGGGDKGDGAVELAGSALHHAVCTTFHLEELLAVRAAFTTELGWSGEEGAEEAGAKLLVRR